MSLIDKDIEFFTTKPSNQDLKTTKLGDFKSITEEFKGTIVDRIKIPCYNGTCAANKTAYIVKEFITHKVSVIEPYQIIKLIV